MYRTERATIIKNSINGKRQEIEATTRSKQQLDRSNNYTTNFRTSHEILADHTNGRYQVEKKTKTKIKRKRNQSDTKPKQKTKKNKAESFQKMDIRSQMVREE